MNDTPFQTIAHRRNDVLSRIESAAKAANRRAKAGTPIDVSLVAISKVQTDARIQAMLEAGQTVFGENRVQEALGRWGERFEDKRAGLTLHLVGPLQTNKAQEAAGFFDVIETLDREKLARKLAEAGQKLGRLPRLFVQVNTGEEPQKAGVLPRDLDAFLKIVRTEYGLSPEGLMCIPPVDEAPSPHFVFLRQLAQRNGLQNLSMGMSADFETAVKLGASHVRVGSALFGARDYS